MKFEKLPGLPPYGPMAHTFGGPHHSEGLVVRFSSEAGEDWIGNFHGGYGRADEILEHPDRRRVIVLSCGQGYLVDPSAPEETATFGWDIHEFLSLPEFDAILFADDLGLETINKQGLWWRTPRISWDGIRNLKVDGATLYGEAFTPVGEMWAPFSVDLRTGDCTDGVYEADMRRAIPVRRP